MNPDVEKLRGYIERIRSVKVPDVKSPEGAEIVRMAAAAFEEVCVDVERHTTGLESPIETAAE